MKSQLTKLVLSIATALSLSANAAITITQPGAGRFAPIQVGLTQEEVRRIAGTPARVLPNAVRGETQWAYNFTDDWGYTSEFDVNFGPDGRVVDVSKERLDY